jgi:ABC-type molybdate transport system substrate-binding protein
VKGAAVGGVFPPEVQTYIVMAAGSSLAAKGTAAREFVTFLMSPANTAIVREKGMERP